MTTTTPSDLTDRQRDVLELHRKGKNPTEIGKELGISSQGVHGHMRRLKQRGLIEDDGPKAGKKPKNGVTHDPSKALEAVQATINQQEQNLMDRLDEIAHEREQLDAEA